MLRRALQMTRRSARLAVMPEILALSLTGILSCIAASLALLRVICKALFSVEFLLTGGEYELLSALIAY